MDFPLKSSRESFVSKAIFHESFLFGAVVALDERTARYVEVNFPIKLVDVPNETFSIESTFCLRDTIFCPFSSGRYIVMGLEIYVKLKNSIASLDFMHDLSL